MSGTHSGAAGTVCYDWERFWIARIGILDLSHAGFLRDSVDLLFVAAGLKRLDSLPLDKATAHFDNLGQNSRDTLSAISDGGYKAEVNDADMRIPTQAGRGFRFDVGQRSDLKPATIPI